MNRLLYILLFILSCGYAFGQTTTNYQSWYKFNYKVSGDTVTAHTAFYAPVRDTNWTPTQIGAMVYKSTDQKVYVCTALTGKKWTQISGGGSSTWGSITGTLSAQSDLKTALDAKQNLITPGTSSQYIKGDFSLGTFSTDVQTVGDALYAAIDHSHTASDITDFTTAVRNGISAGSGISYNPSTGVISAPSATMPTLQQVLSAGSTLTQNNRITLGGYGLGLYNSATAYDTLNASYAEFVRNRGKVHVEDGWVMNHVESTGGNHWGRYSIYRPTSADSVIGVTMFSRNNLTYNWKYSGFESDWSKYARMVVNVNWKRNNLDTSYKGIAVVQGDGLGTAAIQVDPEVLPDATGGEVSISYDPTTKQLRKGGGGGGSSTTLSTLTYGATTTWDYSTQGTAAKVTLTGNTTLSITNLPASVVYLTLEVIQDATGSRTITLPASTKVISGGSGAVTLTTTGGATDLITFYWNGSTLYANYGKNYN